MPYALYARVTLGLHYEKYEAIKNPHKYGLAISKIAYYLILNSTLFVHNRELNYFALCDGFAKQSANFFQPIYRITKWFCVANNMPY